MSRILVVDDARQLLRALRINLATRGYEVQLAPDGGTALTMAGRQPPDLVIVDLGLPDMDGVDVVQGIRGWSTVPIVVLSARHLEQSKVRALDAGADDYVTKPFGMDELLARVRAALRRRTPAPEAPVVRTHAFTVDLYESETNYLRVYLAQLRAKLEPDPARPRHLLTEPGMGYRFQP